MPKIPGKLIKISDDIHPAILEIENRRSDLGMTMRELSEKSKITLPTMWAWRNNIYSPTLSSLAVVAGVLGLEIVVRKAPPTMG